MALPKLNESIKYEMEIPSSKSIVTYRPYLVKEEKILLMAFESQDQKQAMRAMVDTIVACVFEDIAPSQLTTFDVEYMFTQIRSKSVGETSTVNVKCQAIDCEETTEVEINLSELKVEGEDVSNIIELTPTVSIEMRYPSYNTFVDNWREDINESEFGFVMMEDCISAILTEDERYNASDVSRKEMSEFIDSMTNSQFQKVGEYLRTIPSMKKDVEFTCKCGHENKVTLEGLQDFF